MVGAVWVEYRAFPRELPSEKRSRNGRVTTLQVLGVSAPEKRAKQANCGWYRGRNAFRPEYRDEWHIFL